MPPGRRRYHAGPECPACHFQSHWISARSNANLVAMGLVSPKGGMGISSCSERRRRGALECVQLAAAFVRPACWPAFPGKQASRSKADDPPQAAASCTHSKARRQKKNAGKLPALLFALLLWAVSAVAAERYMSVNELTRGATLVARAEIVGVSSTVVETPQGKFPFILYQARLKAAISGACPQNFVVRVPGLIAGNTIIALPDAPALSKGTDAVLFLRPAFGTAPVSNVYELVSLSSGALPVIAAAGGDEIIVVLPVQAPGGEGRGRIKVKLKDLATEVKVVRENQRREEKKP